MLFWMDSKAEMWNKAKFKCLKKMHYSRVYIQKKLCFQTYFTYLNLNFVVVVSASALKRKITLFILLNMIWCDVTKRNRCHIIAMNTSKAIILCTTSFFTVGVWIWRFFLIIFFYLAGIWFIFDVLAMDFILQILCNIFDCFPTSWVKLDW